MTKPKKPRKQYTFGNTLKDGKLYLFQPNELVVIRGWPEMRAWRRTPVRGGWQHIRPELQLVPQNGTFQTARHDSDWLANVCPHDVPRQAPDAADSWLRTRDLPALFRQAAPFCAFELEQIGEALLHKDLARMFEFLAPFPCLVLAATFPFKQRQWHLAAFCARVAGGLQFLRSNPALAFCLASNSCFRARLPSQPMRDARRWIMKKRRAIAAWLGFPDAENSVAILAKIPGDACDVALLKRLRKVLHDDHAIRKVLTHAKAISALTLALCTQPLLKPMLAAPALAQFCQLDWARQREVFELIRVAARLRSLQGAVTPVNWINFRSLRALTREREQILGIADALGVSIVACNLVSKTEHFAQTSFPPWLEEITSAEELLHEGMEMRHCVRAYQLQLQTGSARIFRVFAPERCTVLVTQTGRFEIAGPDNLKVQPETRTAVRAALRPILSHD